jgi:hypothetical protein
MAYGRGSTSSSTHRAELGDLVDVGDQLGEVASSASPASSTCGWPTTRAVCAGSELRLAVNRLLAGSLRPAGAIRRRRGDAGRDGLP